MYPNKPRFVAEGYTQSFNLKGLVHLNAEPPRHQERQELQLENKRPDLPFCVYPVFVSTRHSWRFGG